MSRSASPLRYPGGKACLYELAKHFLAANDLRERGYVEPYSGGCGLALSLLFTGHVSQVHLNDLDRAVWAFWKSTIEHTDELVSLIKSTDITVSEWERQRSVQFRKDSADVVELGFSTFFLNRTNRSGIIHGGGIIGGKSQSGLWKIDCRFNRDDLISRINRVAAYKNRISFYNEDAEAFFDHLGEDIPTTAVVYIDPPYYEKGSQLYKNSYRADDHKRLDTRVAGIVNPWFMTYDNVPTIREIYSSYPKVDLDIGYSVQTKRRGSEIMVLAKGLAFPLEERSAA